MIVNLYSLATLLCIASPVQGRQGLRRDPVSSVSSKGGGGENLMMNDGNVRSIQGVASQGVGFGGVGLGKKVGLKNVQHTSSASLIHDESSSGTFDEDMEAIVNAVGKGFSDTETGDIGKGYLATGGKVANGEKKVEAEKLLGSEFFLEDVVSGSIMLEEQKKLLDEGNNLEEQEDIAFIRSSGGTSVSDGLHRHSTDGMRGPLGENNSVETVSSNRNGRKLVVEEEEHVEVGKWKEDENKDTIVSDAENSEASENVHLHSMETDENRVSNGDANAEEESVRSVVLPTASSSTSASSSADRVSTSTNNPAPSTQKKALKKRGRNRKRVEDDSATFAVVDIDVVRTGKSAPVSSSPVDSKAEDKEELILQEEEIGVDEKKKKKKKNKSVKLPSSAPSYSMMPTVVPSSSTIPSMSPTCQDDTTWTVGGTSAYSGMKCEDFDNDESSTWCETIKSLDDSSNMGKSIGEACCACGGSASYSTYPSVSPTSTPTLSHVPTMPTAQPTLCQDESDWFINEEHGLRCSGILTEDMCDRFASYIYKNKSVREACCVCGGGAHVPEKACVEDTVWFVGGTSIYSGMKCEDLANDSSSFWCATIKALDDSANMGKSIDEACCACGGSAFSTTYPSLVPTNSPTVSQMPTMPTSQPTICQDENDWFLDVEKDLSCNNILKGMCNRFENYIYKNKSVREACCVCGGGKHVEILPTSSPTSSMAPSSSPSLSLSTSPTSDPSDKPSSLFLNKLDEVLETSSSGSGNQVQVVHGDNELFQSNNLLIQVADNERSQLTYQISLLESFDHTGFFMITNTTTIEFHGNAWKVFELKESLLISEITEMSFQLSISESVDAHLICFAKDMDEESLIEDLRCLSLGGESDKKLTGYPRADNIALKKTTIQYPMPSSPWIGPSKAVDGLDSTFTVLAGTNSYWELDLGKAESISRIAISSIFGFPEPLNLKVTLDGTEKSTTMKDGKVIVTFDLNPITAKTVRLETTDPNSSIMISNVEVIAALQSHISYPVSTLFSESGITEIKYIAFIQDSFDNPFHGISSISQIQFSDLPLQTDKVVQMDMQADGNVQDIYRLTNTIASKVLVIGGEKGDGSNDRAASLVPYDANSFDMDQLFYIQASENNIRLESAKYPGYFLYSVCLNRKIGFSNETVSVDPFWLFDPDQQTKMLKNSLCDTNRFGLYAGNNHLELIQSNKNVFEWMFEQIEESFKRNFMTKLKEVYNDEIDPDSLTFGNRHVEPTQTVTLNETKNNIPAFGALGDLDIGAHEDERKLLTQSMPSNEPSLFPTNEPSRGPSEEPSLLPSTAPSALESYSLSFGGSYQNGLFAQDHTGFVTVQPTENNNRNKIEMYGNAWKIFTLPTSLRVYKDTKLFFSFNIDTAAEGHFICVGSNYNEISSREHVKDCFLLGGTQVADFGHMNVATSEQGIGRYSIPLFELSKDKTLTPSIDYIAVIQDSDTEPLQGKSSFWNFNLKTDFSTSIDAECPIGEIVANDDGMKLTRTPSNVYDHCVSSNLPSLLDQTGGEISIVLDGDEGIDLDHTELVLSREAEVLDDTLEQEGSNLRFNLGREYAGRAFSVDQFAPSWKLQCYRITLTSSLSSARKNEFTIEGLYGYMSNTIPKKCHKDASSACDLEICGPDKLIIKEISGLKEQWTWEVEISGDVTTQTVTFSNTWTDVNLMSPGTPGYVCRNSSKKKWQEHQEYAEAMGGNLVTIENEDQNNFIYDNFVAAEPCWIGLKDSNSNFGRLRRWEWADGSNSLYKEWSYGQPDDGDSEDCVEMGGKFHQQWNDNQCHRKIKAIYFFPNRLDNPASELSNLSCKRSFQPMHLETDFNANSSHETSFLREGHLCLTPNSNTYSNHTLGARANGGSLIRIDNPKQANFVFENFLENENIYEGLWISEESEMGDSRYKYLNSQGEVQTTSATSFSQAVYAVHKELDGFTCVSFDENLFYEKKETLFEFVTKCSGQIYEDTGDLTGAPRNLSISQDNGHVTFSFLDNSLCEDGFVFTRSEKIPTNEFISTGVTFTSIFDFINSNADKYNEDVNPELESSDDLTISKLGVGKEYSYCVRAINSESYMDKIDRDSDETFVKVSSPTCGVHRIRWESSISGKITTRLDAGNLPIEQVTVEYELLNEDHIPIPCSSCSGNTTTDEGGNFQIEFNIDHPMLKGKGSTSVPVKLKYNKVTTFGNSVLAHEFLCNDGIDFCNKVEGNLVQLKHLHFEEPVHVYDDTSIPFRGKLFYTNTAFPGSEGCPVVDAEVCLMHRTPASEESSLPSKTELVCVNSNRLGEYNAPIIMGSEVHEVQVRHHQHKFVPSRHNQWNYEDGIVITDGEVYSGHDFMDVSRATLRVEVVGGECSRPLGASTIKVQIEGCEWFDTFQYSGSRRSYDNVPATAVKVQVIYNEYDHIKAYFQNGDSPRTESIDLTDEHILENEIENRRDDEEVSDEPSFAPSSAPSAISPSDQDFIQVDLEEDARKVEEDEISLVRFQYDGTLAMDVIMRSGVENSQECGNSTFVSDIFSSEYGGDSFYVTNKGARVRFKIDLKFELVKTDERNISCDIVGDDYIVTLTNNIGGICSDGCTLDVKHDEVNGQRSGNARAELITDSARNETNKFTVGNPNIIEPYTKNMFFRVSGKGASLSHNAHFFIQGLFTKGAGQSFALPNAQPVMILRDPPGGLSYAKFENVRTTLKFVQETTATTMTVGIETEPEVGGEAKQEACTGLAAMLCNLLSKFDGKAGLAFDGSIGGNLQDYFEEKSNSFSTTWSYTTSTSPDLAGFMSDVFVVPNVFVAFQTYTLVLWVSPTDSLEGQCGPYKENDEFPTYTDFEIDNENTALAFFSRHHIKHVKIPELVAARDEKENLKKSMKVKGKYQKVCCDVPPCLPNTTLRKCTKEEFDEVVAQWKALKQAIKEWTQTLNTAPKTAEITEFFGSKNPFVRQMNDEDGRLKINNHPSGLAPIFYCGDGVRGNGFCEEYCYFCSKSGYCIDGRTTITKCTSGLSMQQICIKKKKCLEQEREKYSKLEEDLNKKINTNRMQFSGGGGVFEMTMNHDNKSSDSGISCWHGCGVEWNEQIKVKQGKEDEISTSVAYGFGDEDVGDEFVVDIKFDKSFGTFIFDTVAGISRCPHEEGTLPAEDPQFTLIKSPSPYVDPDSPMLFEVEIANLGEGKGNFQLKSEQGKDYLVIVVDGTEITEAGTSLTVPKHSSKFKTVALYRDPIAFHFEPVKMFIKTCDSMRGVKKTLTLTNVGEGDEQRIEFLQPCPKISWAGDLQRDRSFILNADFYKELKVDILNNDRVGGTLFAKKEDRRLLAVVFKYRELGDVQWNNGITTIDGEDDEIDFINEKSKTLENNYGYLSRKWNTEHLQEGTYEIMVESECEQVEGNPDLSRFREEIIVGVKDTIRPKQYGNAIPLKDNILLGEEISVLFSEKIDCSYPFKFDATIEIENFYDGVCPNGNCNKELTKRNNDLQIACEGRRIGIIPDLSVLGDVKKFLGKTFLVEIGNENGFISMDYPSHVFDVNGNSLAQNVKFQKGFLELDLYTVSLKLNIALTGSQFCSTESDALSELALALGLTDSSRITISDRNCNTNGNVATFIVLISPPSNSSRRYLKNLFKTENISDLDSLNFLSKLREMNEHSVVNGRYLKEDTQKVKISLLEIIPGEEDKKSLDTPVHLLKEERHLKNIMSTDGDISHIRENELPDEIVRNSSEEQSQIELLLMEQQKNLDAMRKEDANKLDAMRKEDAEKLEHKLEEMRKEDAEKMEEMRKEDARALREMQQKEHEEIKKVFMASIAIIVGTVVMIGGAMFMHFRRA